MILKKQEIDLQFLGIRTLDLCPENSDPAFTDGYINFVEIFFDELDYCSEPFLISLHPHRYEVDLEMVYDETQKELDSISSDLTFEQKIKFWEGVELAIQHSREVLQIAYVAPDKNNDAA